MTDELTDVQRLALEEQEKIEGKIEEVPESPADRFRRKLAVHIHEYKCKSEELDGEVIKFRQLMPGDSLSLEQSALTMKLTELGYRRVGEERSKERFPELEQIEIAIDSARAIVVHSCVDPVFSHASDGLCPVDKVPVESLPIGELFNLVRMIKEVSGVTEAEERFRKVREAEAVVSDGTEPVRSEDDRELESEADSEE